MFQIYDVHIPKKWIESRDFYSNFIILLLEIYYSMYIE